MVKKFLLRTHLQGLFLSVTHSGRGELVLVLGSVRLLFLLIEKPVKSGKEAFPVSKNTRTKIKEVYWILIF